jgi:hypothetical protein
MPAATAAYREMIADVMRELRPWKRGIVAFDLAGDRDDVDVFPRGD